MSSETLSISSTAVDLSRLPAPTIVEQKSYEAIYGELLARMIQLKPDFDATVASDPVVKLIEDFAYREVLLRQQFNDRALGMLLAFARGGDLDHVAAPFGVQRLELVPADPDTGAAAVMEDDDSFLQRILLAPEALSVAGPEAAYRFHARRASADILDVSATSPAPGQVVVTVLTSIGDGSASAEILDAVAAIVNSDPIRPLTDAVAVQSAAIIPYSIAAQLTLFDGPDQELVRQNAITRLDAYIADSRRLGRDVTRFGIAAALGVAGVQNAAISQPADDVICTPLQAGFCTARSITVAGVGD